MTAAFLNPANAPARAPGRRLRVAMFAARFGEIGAIAEALVQAGCEVEVFTLDRLGVDSRLDDNLLVHGCAGRVGARGFSPARRLGGGPVLDALALRRVFVRAHAARPFDVIEAPDTGGLAGLAATAADAPLVLRCVGGRAGGEPNRIRSWLERRAAGRAAARIALSETAREEAEARFGPVAPDREAYAPPPLPDHVLARGQRRAPPDRRRGPVLFAPGAAGPASGIDQSLAALALLTRRAAANGAPPPVLVTAGLPPGEIGRRLVAMGLQGELAARIEDLGPASEAALHAACDRAHIVLAPARRGGADAYRLACAFGRPLVASADDPAARRLIAETPCGRLARATAPAALADAVERLWNDPRDMMRRRRAGLAYARDLSAMALARRRRAVFEAACARAGVS
ncbi:MAG: glycosyltransferase [Oceanicaulis sp.]